MCSVQQSHEIHEMSSLSSLIPVIDSTNGSNDAHNNSINSNIVFSCDLMTNAKKHLEFLKSVHEYYIALNEHDCINGRHESFRRYHELWLPLVAAVVKKTKAKTDTSSSTTTTTDVIMEKLYPPPDVAWLWHCHRLAPKNYTNYCHDTCDGSIIEAHPPFEMAHPSLGTSTIEPVVQQEQPLTSIYFQRTIDLWTEMYPQESFFLQVENENKLVVQAATMESPSTTLLHGLDLLGSAKRQANFFWQMSGERFGDDDFLTEGVENYYRFLQLMPNATKQGTILVPTYQIDLMWHTHILSSIEMYNKDCIRIMNSTMHHDDSLTDRAEGGILDVSFTSTKGLWMKHYGTDYVVDGGMYRGEPPPEYYTSQWQTYEDALPSQIVNMTLIGKVGASSTSKTTAAPTKWAPLYGASSDGSPALIKSAQQTKHGIRSLKYKADYVLGRYGSDTGYYHIETRPANEILKTRVNVRLNKIEREIAFRKSCCGYIRSIQDLKSKREELLQCQMLLQERLAAPSPAGSTKTKQIGTLSLNSDTGKWIYPPVLYTSAGGACGGIVCRDAGGGSGM